MTKHKENVQPLRRKEDIEAMKQVLRKRFTERDYIMFIIGINTGLRIGDILSLKTDDVIGLADKRDKRLLVYEGKTDKPRQISFKNTWKEVYEYAQTVDSVWLFPSRQGSKAISTTQAYRVLSKAAWWNGIEGVGTHTLRKTFGYHMYKINKDVAQLQSIFNHSSPDVTLRYIGITDDELNEVQDSFVL